MDPGMEQLVEDDEGNLDEADVPQVVAGNTYFAYYGSGASAFIGRLLCKHGFVAEQALQRHTQRPNDYVPLLRKGVSFFYVKRRIKYPFDLHCLLNERANRSTIIVNHLAGEWLLTQKNHLARVMFLFSGHSATIPFGACSHPLTFLLTPKHEQEPWSSMAVSNGSGIASPLSASGVIGAVRMAYASMAHRSSSREAEAAGSSARLRRGCATVRCDASTASGEGDGAEERACSLYCSGAHDLWILKPAQGARGQLVQVLEVPRQLFHERSTAEEMESTHSRIEQLLAKYEEDGHTHVVLQRYLADPLLVHGRKFDLRVYVLIASTSPFLAFFAGGFARVCSEMYEEEEFENALGHVTNYNISKHHPQYDATSDTVDSVPMRLSFEELIEHLDRHAVKPAATHGDDGRSTVRGALHCAVNSGERYGRSLEASGMHWVYERIRIALRHTVTAAHQRILRARGSGKGQFCLLGADVMLDTHGDAWVLEYSVGPSLRMKPPWLKAIHTDLLTEAVQLVLDIERARVRLQVSEGSEDLSCSHPVLDSLFTRRWMWLYRADGAQRGPEWG